MTTIYDVINEITISCMLGYTAEFHDDASFLEWARAIKEVSHKYAMFSMKNDLEFLLVNETPTNVQFTITEGDDEGTMFVTSPVRHEFMIETEILSKLGKGMISLDKLIAIEERLV